MIKRIKKELDDVQIVQVIPQQEQQRLSFGIVREPPMLNFDPEQKVNFTIWRRKWSSWYYMVTREGSLDNDQIFHSLMNCFSERTVEYFLNLGLDSVQEKNPELIIERLSGLISTESNHNIHRQEFQMRVQNPGETFDSWLSALKELADQAHFDLDCCGKCKDARLLQQVISGLAKPETRKMLMDIGLGLTLEQATRVIKTTECHLTSNSITANVQNTFLEPITPVLQTSNNVPILNTTFEPMTPHQSNQIPSIAIQQPEKKITKPGQSKQSQPIVSQKITNSPQVDVFSSDGNNLGLLNPYLLNTPTTWTQSFGADSMDQDTAAPELVEGTTKYVKKRKLELPINQKSSNNSVQLETKNMSAVKAKKEMVHKTKANKAPILKIKMPNFQKPTLKLPEKALKSKKESCKEPKVQTNKGLNVPKKIIVPKKTVPKEPKEQQHVEPAPKTSMESTSTDSESVHDNLSTSIEHQPINTCYEEVPNTNTVKAEPAKFHCAQCNKNFSVFYFLKKHKCAAKKMSPPEEINISLCVICEMRFAADYLNQAGRCRLCQGKQTSVNTPWVFSTSFILQLISMLPFTTLQYYLAIF